MAPRRDADGQTLPPSNQTGRRGWRAWLRWPLARAERRDANSKRRRWPFEAGPVQVGVLTTAAGWILDQATKAAAVSELGDGRMVELPGPLYLELTRNAGAAFGLPAPWWVFLLVTAVVIVLVTRNLPRSQSLLEPVAYGLLLAGALGNVTDRLLRPAPRGVGRGEVVDFIATTFRFPTFNVADICITVGFALLVVVAYWQERAVPEEPAVVGTERVPGSA